MRLLLYFSVLHVDTYSIKSLNPSNSVRLVGGPSLDNFGSSDPIFSRNSFIWKQSQSWRVYATRAKHNRFSILHLWHPTISRLRNWMWMFPKMHTRFPNQVHASLNLILHPIIGHFRLHLSPPTLVLVVLRLLMFYQILLLLLLLLRMQGIFRLINNERNI